MVQRLTNSLRDRIAAAAIPAIFDPKSEALAEAEDALGMRFYEKIFSQAELKIVAKLSKRWKAEDSCLRINVGGSHFTFRLKNPVIVPANAGNCHEIGGLSDPEDVEAARAHFDARRDLKEQRGAAHRTLRAMLDTMTTSKQLVEMWPAGKPFYEAILLDVYLPAPVVSAVNEMLGLNA